MLLFRMAVIFAFTLPQIGMALDRDLASPAQNYRPRSFSISSRILRTCSRLLAPSLSVDHETSALVSDAVREIKSDSHFAGDCVDMCRGHVETLIAPMVPTMKEQLDSAEGDNEHPNDYGKVILVFFNDHLIGSIKMVGGQSFIALRDVKNTDGKTVLEIGKVYLVSRSLISALPHPHFSRSPRWARVDVNQLEVKPHADSIINVNSWDDRAMMGVLGRLAGIDSRATAEHSSMIVQFIAKNLRKIREQLEVSDLPTIKVSSQ